MIKGQNFSDDFFSSSKLNFGLKINTRKPPKRNHIVRLNYQLSAAVAFNIIDMRGAKKGLFSGLTRTKTFAQLSL
jgi:hypothetical protein